MSKVELNQKLRHPLIEKMLQDIENKKMTSENSLGVFGNYIIEKFLGGGQQGAVFLVKNKIGKNYALKFYSPTDKDINILNEGIVNFRKEILTTVSLTHRNIVTIITAGTAKYSKGKWQIEEDVANFYPHTENNFFYFYVMEYIVGCDLRRIFTGRDNDEIKKMSTTGLSMLESFEEMITQVSKAIDYYNRKSIFHKDIKPANIIYSQEDGTFIIVDFGFAQSIEKKNKSENDNNEETILRTEYIDAKSVLEKNYEKNDMGQFALMLLDILPTLKNIYTTNRYNGIHDSLMKAQGPLAERFNSMEEFYQSIKGYFLSKPDWKLQLKFDEYLLPTRFGRFDNKIRIPGKQSVINTKEIRKIIDTPAFQHLRGVRQLGPTIFVFPGANHTRFEHSLGVYSLAMKFMERLLKLSSCRKALEKVGIEKSIKLVALSSLLHDIGHYPYSHWIEEIKDFPRGIKIPDHENRALNIMQESTLKEIIEEEWGIDIIELCDIISYKSGTDITGKKDSKAQNKNRPDNHLINSFINSIIDVDKLDYLMRDSLHCGVEYGRGIDISRILDSLYINNDGTSLCLTEKGRSALISILSCRNIMYQEVYWHKTVRACEAMFKRFFYEYTRVKSGKGESKDVNSLLGLCDDQFTHALFQWSQSYESGKFNGLIRTFAYGGREVYKPLYVFHHGDHLKMSTNNFFKKAIDNSFLQNLKLGDSLVKELKKNYKHEFREMEAHHILVERTPKVARSSNVSEFDIFNSKRGDYDPHPKIDSLDDYLDKNRQAYLFCIPKFHDQLIKLKNNGEIDNLFAKLDHTR